MASFRSPAPSFLACLLLGVMRPHHHPCPPSRPLGNPCWSLLSEKGNAIKPSLPLLSCLVISFFGRVRFPSYAWWLGGRDFCVSLLDRQVRPHLCIHPDPATVQPVLGVASVTPTPSTHGYNFRAHRHNILDRNTGVSARFVCLGVHAYYCVSSSNMWWLLD